MNPSSVKKILKPNPLESLREGTREIAESVSREIVNPMTREFLDQLLSRKRKTFSGELTRGESLEMREVHSGAQKERENLNKQVTFERRLREEEQVLVERKSHELSIQINAIHEEVIKIAQATPQLSREVQIASFQAPGSASTYELFFLKHIFDLLRNFRKDIEKASIWLATANSRASKRNVWGQNYKKHGAKYLLSGEHYSGRSAA